VITDLKVPRVDGAWVVAGVTSWLKVKNPHYSQGVDRHELFEKRRPKADRTK
jgi:hypothetical protein